MADICRHLALRYLFTNNPDIINRLGACLDQILTKEKESVSDLLEIWPD